MILVVGAGPAGMAAAVRARECGKRVTVLDDNPTAGGQIWRGGTGSAWFTRFRESGAVLLTSRRVIGGNAARRTLQVETPAGASELEYETLILATGARELFLPFPGWTLPNVMGVGGLQALVKSGLPVTGKRVVVAGSGPLLLAVAQYLRKHGASVPVVAEQASWGALARFAAHLTPTKLLQAAALQTMAYQPNSWVVQAEGSSKLEQVQLSNGKSISCDYLAVAYGFVPNNELATLLGPAEHILQAGECTGIGGVELSVIEGEIAGYTAGGRPELAPKKQSAQRFADALNRTFAPRFELRTLCQPGTIVCRCEDVPFQRLESAESWREAKLHFRCGMGPCQGRICGPAVNLLFNWQSESIRPPVFPARVSSLITSKETTTK
jgi:D-hydroxyproline dehydrogenase subunit alpha